MSGRTWEFGAYTNTQHVISFEEFFDGCRNFNGILGGTWDLSSCTTIRKMFYANDEFNQPLNHWNTRSVNIASEAFASCHNFNQPLGDWDTSWMASMTSMFAQNYELEQDFSQWCVTQFAWAPSNFFFNATKMLANPALHPPWGSCPRGEDKLPRP